MGLDLLHWCLLAMIFTAQFAIAYLWSAADGFRRLYYLKAKELEIKAGQYEALKAAVKICAICPMREEEEQEAIQLARQLH